ncbi:hypothetical protein K474DRAFT_979463 [Panus rudis PR-1116 ss-1]|nr:hypothetical protein K474DRAFT_979463 [Panus rudis PR-1116 ss-1]
MYRLALGRLGGVRSCVGAGVVGRLVSARLGSHVVVSASRYIVDVRMKEVVLRATERGTSDRRLFAMEGMVTNPGFRSLYSRDCHRGDLACKKEFVYVPSRGSNRGGVDVSVHRLWHCARTLYPWNAYGMLYVTHSEDSTLILLRDILGRTARLRNAALLGPTNCQDDASAGGSQIRVVENSESSGLCTRLSCQQSQEGDILESFSQWPFTASVLGVK